MMITFSNYDGADPKGAAAQDAVGYMSAAMVPKPNNDRGTRLIERVPAPEILIGDGTLMRAAIRAAPGILKYRSGVLSFAAADIDCAAFNAGSKDARGAADLALRLWVEVGFAGIPESCRPPLFVTTHTHTGRLELNVLAPRWVMRPDGTVRSYNPDPPGTAGRNAIHAVEDILNQRFGWADPRAPDRAQLVKVPDWRLKQRATAQRDGNDMPLDHREELAQAWNAPTEVVHLLGYDYPVFRRTKRWLESERSPRISC